MSLKFVFGLLLLEQKSNRTQNTNFVQVENNEKEYGIWQLINIHQNRPSDNVTRLRYSDTLDRN